MKEPPTQVEIRLDNLHATCEAQRELLAQLVACQCRSEYRLATIGNWLMLLAILAILAVLAFLGTILTR